MFFMMYKTGTLERLNKQYFSRFNTLCSWRKEISCGDKKHCQLVWKPNFSNPLFFEPHDKLNQRLFPSPQSNNAVLPLGLSAFSYQVLFPLEVPKIGIQL